MANIGNLDEEIADAIPAIISIRDLKTHCMTCSMRELCLPVGLDRDAMRQNAKNP